MALPHLLGSARANGWKILAPGFFMQEGKNWMECPEIQLFWGWLKIMYDTIMMDICHYSFLQPLRTYNTRVKCNAKCELWMIMMCQYSFISYNKCITLVGNVDSEGSLAWVGSGINEKISVTSFQFCYKPECALKIKA